MRKKSHISLARYIVKEMEVEELMKHRKAFCLGSILPDCKPSFFTIKHEFNGTFDKMQSEIARLTAGNIQNNMRVYCRDLGQVIHFIADYFTFPHNQIFPGTLKDHCIYEKELKYSLRSYIKSGEAQSNHQIIRVFKSAEEICEFIEKSHEEYLKMKKTVKEDCKYIVSICHQVVIGILSLIGIYCKNSTELEIAA